MTQELEKLERQHRSIDELTLGSSVTFEQLVNRDALSELATSFNALIHVPLRIFDRDGKLLADAAPATQLLTYLGGLRGGRKVLGETVDRIKALKPEEEAGVLHHCGSGVDYFICGIDYDSRMIGKIVIGPFVAPEQAAPPETFWSIDPELDRTTVRDLFATLPRIQADAVQKFAEHLKKTLDLVLFSGHRALLTTNVHLASVRESYRELQEKNEQLQSAFNRLKELDRLKSNFLATISHELRTPLTSIIGYSEMLVEGLAGPLAEEQLEFIRTIRDKGDQLLSLIKGLLDLSKLESGTMTLRKAQADAWLVVRDAVHTVAPLARKKAVLLSVDVEQKLPLLWADAERLRQVFINLIDNAVKFTPADGEIRVSAKLSSMGAATAEDSHGAVLLSTRRATIEFRVADTGVGIPEAEKQRVFDPFYQVDSSSTREQEGTGLGLSIVKRLVEGHGGSVHIEDNVPHGAVFVVQIPINRATVS